MKSFLPGFWLAFWLHQSVIQRFKTKRQNINNNHHYAQSAFLTSMFLRHKKGTLSTNSSPWIFKWHSKTPAFLPGKRYRVDWHYIEFTRVSDHTVTNAMWQKNDILSLVTDSKSLTQQKLNSSPLTNSHAPKHWYSSIIIIVSFFVTMKKHLIFWTFRTSVFFALLTKVIY